MQLRADVALASAVKSLTDVVLPAVDPDNAPALEQLQVVIGLLSLLAARLPLEFDYDRDELERLCAFGEALVQATASAAPAETATLAGVNARASAVLDRARATPRELLDAIRDVRVATASVVGAAYVASAPATRGRLARLVRDHARAQLERERAWVKPQGWEADPSLIPEIETLLAR